MKKHFRVPLFLLIAIMLLTLCGCSRYVEPETKTSGLTTTTTDVLTYSLNPETKTLVCNNTTYTYSIDYSDSAITYTIHYPNGGTYYETCKETNSVSGWDGDLSAYVSGDDLVEILSGHYYIASSGGQNILLSLLFLAIGAFTTFCPYAAWYLRHGWHYENAESSQASLTVGRVCGVIIMVIGVIVFFL